MRYIKFILLGLFFGIVLYKAEVISWFRIFEMFHFQSFHMYGVIGSAVGVGALLIALIKRTRMKGLDGKPIVIEPKDRSLYRYLFGGTLFGFGWAMTGACPGPMFILLGSGATVFVVVIFSAVLGTFVYGLLYKRLPH
jgi:uncharacterized membrane protein YedE/YeeE